MTPAADRTDTGIAHSLDYDQGKPCAWCGKEEDGGLDCTGPAADRTEGDERWCVVHQGSECVGRASRLCRFVTSTGGDESLPVDRDESPVGRSEEDG